MKQFLLFHSDLNYYLIMFNVINCQEIFVINNTTPFFVFYSLTLTMLFDIQTVSAASAIPPVKIHFLAAKTTTINCTKTNTAALFEGLFLGRRGHEVEVSFDPSAKTFKYEESEVKNAGGTWHPCQCDYQKALSNGSGSYLIDETNNTIHSDNTRGTARVFINLNTLQCAVYYPNGGHFKGTVEAINGAGVSIWEDGDMQGAVDPSQYPYSP